MSTPLIRPTSLRNNPSLSGTLNDGWRQFGGSAVAVYASATTFTLTGDFTLTFTRGRRLRIYHATAAAYKYVTVISSSYGAPTTTVTVSGDTLLNQTYSSIWVDLSPAGYADPLAVPGALTAGDILMAGSDTVLTRLGIGNSGEFLMADPTGFPNYLPDGRAGMINGKITTTVASNNLTVAIKTLAGTDPSTTDPVYVRIGNSIRAITAALSVTKNAGTNWFGSGSVSVATVQQNYYVYLLWNTTANPDAVTLAFALKSNGLLYSDFNNTTTSPLYLAFSGSDTPTSTDEMQNVGRFNAILSATAAFTWSFPAISKIVQHPIVELVSLHVQNVTTNILTGNQVIYRGWGYTANSGATSCSVTITLPNSGFDDADYDIAAIYLGEKATTPANRHDATSANSTVTAVVNGSAPTTATQFTLVFNSNGGGNLAIVLFSWIAIGTKA